MVDKPLSGPVLVLGSGGMLGQALMRFAKRAGTEAVGVSRRPGADIKADLTEAAEVARVFHEVSPSVVVNAAAITSLDNCEASPGVAYLLHARLPALLANLCRQREIPFVQVSTDHYYDSGQNRRHVESEPVQLLNEYARSKYAGEKLAETYAGALIIRTNIVGFRGWPGQPTFVEWVVESLRSGRPFSGFDDMWTSSIDVVQFCPLVMELVERGARGVLNVSARTPCSKHEFIRKFAERAGMDALHMVVRSAAESLRVPRATCLGLDVSRAEEVLQRRLPDTDEVIHSLVLSLREIAV